MPERVGNERPRPGGLPLEEVADRRNAGAASACEPGQPPRPDERQVFGNPSPEVREDPERLDVETAEVAPPGQRKRRVCLSEIAPAAEGFQPGAREKAVSQRGRAEIEEHHRRVEVRAE